jgi:hypothetical protein
MSDRLQRTLGVGHFVAGALCRGTRMNKTGMHDEEAVRRRTASKY